MGIVTRNDFDFCSDTSAPISSIMSTELVTAGLGTTVREAHNLMLSRGKKILPIINDGKLESIYTFSDVKRILFGNSDGYNLDSFGRLRVGAAIGVREDAEERLELLSQKLVDVVVIDTAHGHSQAVIDTIKYAKKNYPNLDVVAGNIATAEAATCLAEAGADAVKVGIGPGSICTTRKISGVGMPQLTAIYECSKALRSSGIPVIADGGMTTSGDMALAIAVGASSAMFGNMFAGTTESPGEIKRKGDLPYKVYRGMGSLEAMSKSRASRQRYGQPENETATAKLVPEGVSGWVPYKGDVGKVVFQLVGGLRAGMAYVGSLDIPTMQSVVELVSVDADGERESKPHNLAYAEEAPNYKF